MARFGVSSAFLAYTLTYAIATLGCGIALFRARRVTDRDTRRGLVGLLAASGGWAALELAFLVAPTPATAYVTYTLSLVVGLTTVGAWLYFCSAYTGRSFHRNQFYRRLSVAVYLGIVAVKLTNPIHGLYFDTALVTTPFPHMTIRHELFHWVVAGLSYALVSVGIFMLYEMFLDAEFDTRPLAALVGVTAVPVVLDIVGFSTDYLIDINYEPIGVAVFAIGVLYVYQSEFLTVQLTDGVEDPVIYLDGDEIRKYNRMAERLFPELSGSTGDSLPSVAPDAAAALESDTKILERSRDGEPAYYLVSETTFALGQASIGRLVVFTDVTETEGQRRELVRQNEQLEGFAAAIRHELLNTLQVVSARVDIAGKALDDGDVTAARDSLRTASGTTDRMSSIVGDLATLARYGQTVEAAEVERVGLADIAGAAWERADTGSMALSVDGDATLSADPARLRSLFVDAFDFAAHNDATMVTVRPTDDGFTITDDGNGVGDNDPDEFFEYGSAIPDAEAGLDLPNLRMLAETHGWDATLDTAYQDGIRIVVSGVTTLRAESDQPPTRH
ncbi:histidine kinase N-terminal 7TM domain-containing protein [Haloarcula rara]|uniref:sensor histidine kinase n=1 Tax=Haloarcula rara TaxID=3033387 RepID=UPI0023E843F6|nr:histidine kinase N-terminal 7TM domain-containing protein [Halomicroarcula sp. SHR3]